MNQDLTAILTLVGTISAFVLFLWRAFKFFTKLLDRLDNMDMKVDRVVAEVTPNGGSSLKDVVNGLQITCENIEERQLIADQRSKAALHYHVDALFEIDEEGKLTWCNERFRQITSESGDIEDGHDWISIIHDESREHFLAELRSCLEMRRKIDVDVIGTNGSGLRITGFPYKVSTTSHKGYLVNCFYHDLNLI